MMKFCPYCGAALVDGAASFCMECGKKIPGSSIAPDPTETESLQPNVSQERLVSRQKERPRATAPSQNSASKGNHVKKKARKTKKKTKSSTAFPAVEHTDDGYDGYYDDVLPPDLERAHDGVDKELVKKIGLLAGAVFLVVALCVLMMYLL